MIPSSSWPWHAAAGVGIEPSFEDGGGGSDANVFNAAGVPSVLIGVGYDGPHSPSESISVENSRRAADFVTALIETAAEAKAVERCSLAPEVVVVSIDCVREGAVELTVEIERRRAPARSRTRSLVGPVEPGDEVLLNTTAVRKSLGTGGFTS